MSRPEPDRPERTPAEHAAGTAFARFARQRRARDFVAAFDAAAQDLLLVATRLVHRNQIDDLLQQTRQGALQRAESYDPQRPLLPWLIGIQLREARRMRRDDARRGQHLRRVAADSELEPSSDPSRSAETTELSIDLARALDGLDAVDRQVLMLRLRHGLSSVEIGQALGRSPETVRSQLSRGLRRLRRLLPAGHTLPALALADLAHGADSLVSSARLHAIRDVLVSEFAVAGVATPAVLLLGGLAMKKLAVTTAEALTVVAAWILLDAPGDSQLTPPAAGGGVA